MKNPSFFLLLLVLQVCVILFVPGLSKSSMDTTWLMGLSCLYCVMFIWGAVKMGKSLHVSQSQFNARYFGSMGLRMAVCLASIAIYLKFSQPVNKPASIFLICSYFVYMSFEIRIILHKLRSDSEKSKNADNP